MRHDWFWALALPNILATVTQSIIKLMEDHAVIHHYYNYPKYLDLSHDVTYRTDITPCIRINTPLVIYMSTQVRSIIYCKFGNYHKNFIFPNSVKRHICHFQNS